MKDIWKRICQDYRRYYPALLIAVVYIIIMQLSGKKICPLANMTGLPCPGCGLSRAAVLFIQGDFAGAWKMHPFFYFFLILAVVCGICRYGFGMTGKWMTKAAAAVGVGAVIFYIYRMYGYFPNEEPMVYRSNNLLASLLKLIKK